MGSGGNVSLLIAVGHQLFHEGLRLILKDEADFSIVGMVNNGVQAVEAIAELKPDVVLLDIALPDINALSVLSLIKQKSPGTRTLMITHDKDEQEIIKAIRAGAKGYLSNNTNVKDLKKAIQIVHRGEFWVPRKLIGRLTDGAPLSNPGSQNIHQNKLSALPPREQDVLSALVKGATNKEIARELFISEKTVKSHLNQVFKKLDVSRRLEAILSAIKAGLV